MDTLLTSKLKWEKFGFDEKTLPKELVLNLINSTNESEATKAYWKLEGQVCRNGLLSEAAYDVTVQILSVVPNCNSNSKYRCLELLGQIIVSEPVQSNSNVLENCLSEMYGISWWLLNQIEFGEPKKIWLYVDIVGVLALKFEKFKLKVVVYLENCLSRSDIPNSDLKMIKNTLSDLR